jgi:hypothetical protein
VSALLLAKGAHLHALVVIGYAGCPPLPRKEEPVLAGFALTATAPLDESQKLAAVVGALLLGHDSDSQVDCVVVTVGDHRTVCSPQPAAAER